MTDLTPKLEKAYDEGGRDLVAVYLAGAHLPGLPKPVTDKVFAKAWEDGHASGIYEVEMHYQEIAEIVQAAFEAGNPNSTVRPMTNMPWQPLGRQPHGR